MAEQRVPPVQVHIPLENLTESLNSLQRELRTGRLGKQIGQFNGDGSRRFRDWLTDMERIGQAVGANDEVYRIMCLETLKGPALDQFTRLINGRPHMLWAEIVTALRQRYFDEADSQIALQKLNRLKQRKGESTLVYVERIRALAEEAYHGQDMAQNHIQTSMTGALINGIMDDGVARRLIRDRPANFEAAATVAMREQQAAKQFAIRRREDPEPMDVSQVMAHPAVARLEAKIAHLEREVEAQANQAPELTMEQQLELLNAKIAQLESAQRSKPPPNKQARYRQNAHPASGPMPRFEWTPDGKPICAHCRSVGHIRRDCRKRKRKNQFQKPQGNW